MVFHRSRSNSKSVQVSRTLLSILTDLNNAFAWMLSIRLLNSYSFRSLTKPLGTVPNAPITIGINITIMFLKFLSFLARSTYLFLFGFLWFSLSGLTRRRNPLYGKFSFIFLPLFISKSGLLIGIRWFFNLKTQPPDCTWGSPHSSAHPGTLWY